MAGRPAGHSGPRPDRERRQRLYPQCGPASPRSRLHGAAAERARCGPVARLLRRALPCRPHRGLPPGAVAVAGGVWRAMASSRSAIRRRRDAAEVSRRGRLVFAVACRGDRMFADRPDAQRAAHAEAAQLALSQLHPDRPAAPRRGRGRASVSDERARDHPRRRRACSISTIGSSRRVTDSRRRRTITALLAAPLHAGNRRADHGARRLRRSLIPVEHYREVKWADNPWLLPVMPATGGHVGFQGHAGDRPWCDIAVEKFLARACA